MIFRKKKFAAIIFFVFVLAGAFFAWDFFTDNAEFVPYSEFYALAENGKIASVRFSGEKLFFTQKNQAPGSEDFSAEKEFYTDNPESPLLKEFLMRILRKMCPGNCMKNPGGICALLVNRCLRG